MSNKANNPHPDDLAVDQFAIAMKAKLARARAKGRGGWSDTASCPDGRLQEELVHHIGKGDPLDVGALAMMLWFRGESTQCSAYATLPTMPTFYLDKEAAGLLRWLLGDEEEAAELTLSLGELVDDEDPKGSFGLRAHQTEYEEEGGVMLADIDRAPPAIQAFNDLPFVLEQRGRTWFKHWVKPKDAASGKEGGAAMVATATEIALWQVLQAAGVTSTAKRSAAKKPEICA